MLDIIYKIWNYGGYFYLTLIFAAFLYIFKSSKDFLLKFIFISAIIISCFFSLREISKFKDLALWKESLVNRIDESSLGFYTFINDLSVYIPNQSTVCLIDNEDTSIKYIISRLYPRKIKIISDDNFNNCHYLISPFRELNHSKLILFLSKNNHNGYYVVD